MAPIPLVLGAGEDTPENKRRPVQSDVLIAFDLFLAALALRRRHLRSDHYGFDRRDKIILELALCDDAVCICDDGSNTSARLNHSD